MSRLLVVTRPSLAPGFHLAGVEAFAAEDAEAAQVLIAKWIDTGETGLLLVDDGLLDGIDLAFRRRLETHERLPYIAIPGGEPLGPERSRRSQLAELIRRAIGVHITFRGQQSG